MNLLRMFLGNRWKRDPNIQVMWGWSRQKESFHLTDCKKYQELWDGSSCWDTEEDDPQNYLSLNPTQEDSSN